MRDNTYNVHGDPCVYVFMCVCACLWPGGHENAQDVAFRNIGNTQKDQGVLVALVDGWLPGVHVLFQARLTRRDASHTLSVPERPALPLHF